MSKKIRITTGKVETVAILNNTATAAAIWENLPIEGEVKLWGDEIYFSTSLSLPQENPRETVRKGDIAYWAPEQALCIFFGPTPVSQPGEIRPNSSVDVIGQLMGEADICQSVQEGDKIVIERLSE